MELREEQDRNLESEEQKRALKRIIQVLEQMFIEQRHSLTTRRVDYEYEIHHLNQTLDEVRMDRDAWKAQCFARQMYIKHMLGEIDKAIIKANEMLVRAKELRDHVFPIGKYR